MTQTNIDKKDAIIIPFNEYSVHYYSQSSNPWEAAYINCFQNCKDEKKRQAGIIMFTYTDGTMLPGQENPAPGYIASSILAGQVNHLETRESEPFFVIYYNLSRFDDIINLLRYAMLDNCDAGEKSMCVSADAINHVWALCNNLRPKVGAQY
jgi:Ulp1 family protease